MFSRFFAGSYSSDEDSQSYSDEYDDADTKSMADYYNDLEAIIANIRQEVEDADTDPAFHKAATALTKIIHLCKDIESSYNPLAALETNSKRSKLIKTIGPNGMIEIKGEASRQLVEEYKDLMIAVANKEYFPNPPMIYAPVVIPRYENELKKRAMQTAQRIKAYEDRIEAYDAAKASPRPG